MEMVMYSVHQHWDKLKTCIVGRSYPPEFYSYITNHRIRNVMERIAIETEEDYQKLISLLKSFNVEIMRPNVKDSINYYKLNDGVYRPPYTMTPRDFTAMIGSNFYFDLHEPSDAYKDILKNIKNQKNKLIYNQNINSAMVTRIGHDLYFGTQPSEKFEDIKSRAKIFPDYRCHVINSDGHTDACFCPVVPELIISLYDIQEYEKTFPNWEVIYLKNQSWEAVEPFMKLKEKNGGKWWVAGEELNDEFTEFVENWLGHWVGYVEESVFDVNMLVIDKKNVVCNNYNKEVFDAFERYGITPHIINFRHRYFWDGGLHCITSDIDREGTMQDYFPERGEP
jgi:N-dimethylarginine dimethylaminohydrolase